MVLLEPVVKSLTCVKFLELKVRRAQFVLVVDLSQSLEPEGIEDLRLS